MGINEWTSSGDSWALIDGPLFAFNAPGITFNPAKMAIYGRRWRKERPFFGGGVADSHGP